MTEREHQRSVARFGTIMVAQLDANSHKGGWEDMSCGELLERLQQEASELAEVIAQTPPCFASIQQEAADVANFAMMVADVAEARAVVTGENPMCAPRFEWKP